MFIVNVYFKLMADLFKSQLSLKNKHTNYIILGFVIAENLSENSMKT